MSIEDFITKIAVQTAVHWANPVSDGYGGFTFDEAVEVAVRWDNVSELIALNNGEQYVCKAKILSNLEATVGEYLYLGSLDDLDSDTSDPKSIEGAYRIMRFDKVPMIKKTDVFVRTIYL